MIPVYRPHLSPASLRYAHDAIDSGWLSYIGPYKAKAADKLAELLGVRHVLLTMNGTTACHLMARALLHFHPNIRKIIVPNNVYVAAWNAFLYDRQADLIPIEPDPLTWNVDETKLPAKIEADTAVLICHNLGGIVNVPALKRRYPGTIFVEDNCEGFGGKYEGVYSGTASLCSALSFFGNKNITCGEGGALMTNDRDVFDFATRLHDQATSSRRYVHDELGYNYRMTNPQAALLYGQMEIFAEIAARKAELFDKYRRELHRIPGVTTQAIAASTEHANWMMGIRFAGASSYDQTEKFFNQHGVDVRPLFYPITVHAHLKQMSCTTRLADELSRQCIMAPSFPDLSPAEFDQVVATAAAYSRSL